MPESSELAELPASSPLKHLCYESIDLIKRLDPMLAHLAKEKGTARLEIEVRRGEPLRLHVSRSFNIGEAL